MKTLNDLRTKWGRGRVETVVAGGSPEAMGEISSTAAVTAMAPELAAEVRNEYAEIWGEAQARVRRIARLLDLIRSKMVPSPGRVELSDAFVARDRQLVAEIEAIWLGPVPRLAEFKTLVGRWQQNCLVELRAQIAQTGSKRG